MFDYLENLSIVSSFHQGSKTYGKIENRKSHGFVFKISGYTEYAFGDKRIRVNAGEMIFLPKGASYTYTTHPQGTLYTSINFEADFDNREISVYSLDDFYGYNYISRSFTERWRFGDLSDKFKCISIFYDLLSYVSKIEHLRSMDKRKYSIIDPAVEYLKKHIYSSNFKIEKLHRLCGISDTYFRAIFMKRFHMTPQEYVVAERISYAKSIIESGDYETIREVSELVGYNDPLYFSKAFKKVYGFSPSTLCK